VEKVFYGKASDRHPYIDEIVAIPGILGAPSGEINASRPIFQSAW
jgi:hypothetical protein